MLAVWPCWEHLSQHLPARRPHILPGPHHLLLQVGDELGQPGGGEEVRGARHRVQLSGVNHHPGGVPGLCLGLSLYQGGLQLYSQTSWQWSPSHQYSLITHTNVVFISSFPINILHCYNSLKHLYVYFLHTVRCESVNVCRASVGPGEASPASWPV